MLDRAGSADGLKIAKTRTSLLLITDPKGDHDNCQKINNSKHIKECAIKTGANFASINIIKDMSMVSRIDDFGTNHLDIADGPDIATKIYKWLCA